MASAIDATKPADNSPALTSDLRANLLTAKNEISALQASPSFTGAITSPAYILAAGGIITDATTARTLSAGDNGKVLYFTNAAAITLTLAASLGVGFACTVVQGAAGQVTFAAGGQTMTIAGGLTKTASVGAMASVLAPAANTFFVAGTLA